MTSGSEKYEFTREGFTNWLWDRIEALPDNFGAVSGAMSHDETESNISFFLGSPELGEKIFDIKITESTVGANK